MKWDPRAVALEMECGLSNTGSLLLDRYEWLTETQIKEFFGHLAAARRKHQSSQTASKSQRPSTSSHPQSDLDEESEELDTTALSIDEIISKVSDQNGNTNVLQPTTALTNTQQHKKKDISIDDIQNVSKRLHK